MLESCETFFHTLCTYHFWKLEGSRWHVPLDELRSGRPDVTEGCATALIPFRPGQMILIQLRHSLRMVEADWNIVWDSAKFLFRPLSQKVRGIISKSSIMKSWMALSCHDCNSEPGPSHLEQVEVYRHDLMTSRHPRPQLPCLRTLAHSGAIKKCQMVVAVSVASIHFKVSLLLVWSLEALVTGVPGSPAKSACTATIFYLPRLESLQSAGSMLNPPLSGKANG